MAIHYLGDIRHVTCQTASGHRRSPMIDIAYNSGQVLTDTTTGRQHSRPHRDGTVILATDIVSADENCPYGDTSVPSAQRREQMYNELYLLNKRNDERVYAKTQLGLPDSYTDEQAVIVAKATALSFSKRLGIPMDFSVHKKRTSKRNPHKNLHVHLAFAERKWEHDHWGAKTVSYYIDMAGNILYDKQYKDADGNDIRKPRIIKGTPKSEKYKKDADGHYIYQVRDKKGRRRWCMPQTEGLSPEDLKWMHEEVDRINNHYLSLFNIPDRVQRNDKRVTQKLKELDMQPVHIGRKDYQAKNENYEQKIAWNKKSALYRDTLTEIYKTHDKLTEMETQMEYVEKHTAEIMQSISASVDNEKLVMDTARSDYESALAEYVEELCPQDIFIQNGVSLLNGYMTQREKILTETAKILEDGIQLAEKDIPKLKVKTSAEEYHARRNYMTKNQQFMKSLLSSIRQYAKRVPVIEEVKNFLSDRWKEFSNTERVAYIRDSVGQEESSLYADYLHVGEIKIDAPKYFTFSVPKIDTDAKIASTLQTWKYDTHRSNHYPPINVNLMRQLQAQDTLVTGVTSENSIIPDAYTPATAYKKFIEEINAVRQQQQEKSQSVAANAEPSSATVKDTNDQSVATNLEPSAKTVTKTDSQSVAANAEHIEWSRTEYDRISALTDAEKMRKIQETADARIKAGTDYTREELIKRYQKHSREFSADMKKLDIDHAELERLSADRKAYWQLGPKYKALQEQKRKSSQDITVDREQNRTVIHNRT